MIDSVAEIWREILGRDDVDADSNFFMLGGDSLSATVLMVHLEEKAGLMLDPAEIFETPVLREFVDRIMQVDPALTATGGAVTQAGVL